MQLSSESHKYISFLTKNYQNRDEINFENQSFKRNIKQIFHDVSQGSKWVSQNFDENKIIINKIDIISQIPRPSGFNSRWIDTEIKQHIFNNSIYKIHYTFKINKRTINISFVVENDAIKNRANYINHIKSVMNWISIANKYSCINCGTTLNLYIYMTSLKKKLPDNRWDTISSTEVNSVLSDMCRKNSEIIIFRKEEWFKVLIHETFHNYGLDFSIMNISKLVTIMKNKFNIESDFAMYETYTEFWARIINTVYCSFNICSESNKFTDFYLYFQVLFYYERLFTLLQCTKVLAFMNLSLDIITDNSKKNVSMQLYKENTNVFPYYIGVGILMINPESYFEWVDNNNINIFRFQKTDENLISFGNYITDTVDSKKCKIILQKFMKLIPTLKDNTLNTTRMTMCDVTELETHNGLTLK